MTDAAIPFARPLQTETYRVFLSSGDDARILRDRIEKLIQEAFNTQLMKTGSRVRLETHRWEHQAAQKPREGGTINDMFVEQARQSDVTVAILLDELRSGTREELIAVLGEPSVELMILWFPSPGKDGADSPVGNFLADHRNAIFYNPLPDPESLEGWVGLVRNLTYILLRSIGRPTREPVYESR